jgi:large subunit ribosomal protein L24
MKKIQKSHVKKGDQVKVISGEQKGFLGVISSVIKKKSSVILEGILPRVKYVKNAQSAQGEPRKIELPILIHVSNVMLWDKEANKPSRIGYKNSTSGTKTEKKRYFKKSGNLI